MNKELKQVRICLGRFQPFTLGHLKMALYKELNGPDKEQLKSLREQPDLDIIKNQKTILLVISTSKDKIDERHPFEDELMKKEFDIIQQQYGEIEKIIYVKSADICYCGEILKQNGYQASVWLCGSDSYSYYKKMAMNVPKYEIQNRDNRDCKDAYTKSFYVENIERNENDFISSISGTKVRETLLNNDKDLFISMMPKETEILFDNFRQAIINI